MLDIYFCKIVGRKNVSEMLLKFERYRLKMLEVTQLGKRMVACLPLGCPKNPVEQELCVPSLGCWGRGLVLQSLLRQMSA